MDIQIVSAQRPVEEYSVQTDYGVIEFSVFPLDAFVLEVVNQDGKSAAVWLTKSQVKKVRKMLRRHK